MKVAISAQNDNLNTRVDSHFGRCKFFMIYDTQTNVSAFIANQFCDKIEGAGSSAAEFVVSLGVETIISCEFGIKAKTVFDKYKIPLIILPQQNQTLKQIISLLQNKTK